MNGLLSILEVPVGVTSQLTWTVNGLGRRQAELQTEVGKIEYHLHDLVSYVLEKRLESVLSTWLCFGKGYFPLNPLTR